MQDHLEGVAALLKVGPVGLLLDLDGTISEIVSEPQAAAVSPAIKSALRELCLRLALVAVITGRSAWQARDIVGLQELTYVGNHGLERLERGRFTLTEGVQAYVPFLKRLLERLGERFPPSGPGQVPSSGLTLEDKESSFAVHYRLARDPDKARDDALEAIRELAGGQVRVLMGKAVINVLPPVNLTKGTAVISLVTEHNLSGAVLIGDDVTDIDSFRAARDLSSQGSFSGISVAVVGPDSPPELEKEADFTLSMVSEVGDFLKWLVGQVDSP